MSASLILAMDTSTSLGTVAVASGPDVLSRSELGPQGTHAARLIPSIAEVLDDAGVDRAELEAVVVGGGPGSFTGVRVAAATAKGLTSALGIPMYTFSSLAAGAAGVDSFPGPALDSTLTAHRGPEVISELRKAEARYILFDARSDRVYAACYVPTSKGLESLIAPHATTVGELLAGEVPLSVFGGDGAERHLDEIRGAGFVVLPPPLGMPTADGLVQLFAADPDPEPISDPRSWEPEYLRATGAERMRRGH